MDKAVKEDALRFAKKLNLNFTQAIEVLTTGGLDKIASYFGLSEQLQKEQAAILAEELKSMQQYYLDRIRLATTQEEKDKIDEQSAKMFIRIIEQQKEFNQKHIEERKFNKEKIVELVKGIGTVVLGVAAIYICNKSETSEGNGVDDLEDEIIDVNFKDYNEN